MTTLYRGESRIITRNLKNADGTALAASALAAAQLELLQAGVVKHTFVRGEDAELRNGTDGYSLEYELTSAVTAALQRAVLKERWKLEISDEDYVVEPGKEIQIIELSDLKLQ